MKRLAGSFLSPDLFERSLLTHRPTGLVGNQRCEHHKPSLKGLKKKKTDLAKKSLKPLRLNAPVTSWLTPSFPRLNRLYVDVSSHRRTPGLDLLKPQKSKKKPTEGLLVGLKLRNHLKSQTRQASEGFSRFRSAKSAISICRRRSAPMESKGSCSRIEEKRKPLGDLLVKKGSLEKINTCCSFLSCFFWFLLVF